MWLETALIIVLIALWTLFLNFLTLFVALFILKQSFSPKRVMAFLTLKDPETKHSILSAVLSSVRQSFAGSLGGRPPKQQPAGGLEQMMAMLSMMQGMGKKPPTE